MDTPRTAGNAYQEAMRAASFGLVVNLFLGALKLGSGILGNSFALIADAVNSLGDAATTLVVIFALRVAQKPPDAEHPYGHTRAEAIAASNIAVLIMVSAALLAWEALQRIPIDHAIPPHWTLWIAGVNVVIKEALYHYKMRIGLRTGSTAMIANAWDHRSDALCSFAVLIGLGLIRWGGEEYIWADEVASLMVAAAITWSALILFRKSASELMDVQASEDFVLEIQHAAESVERVEAVETIWVRKSGLEYFADLHIEVDPRLTVAEGHAISHDVKKCLLERFPGLRDVLIHLEPAAARHEAS